MVPPPVSSHRQLHASWELQLRRIAARTAPAAGARLAEGSRARGGGSEKAGELPTGIVALAAKPAQRPGPPDVCSQAWYKREWDLVEEKSGSDDWSAVSEVRREF